MAEASASGGGGTKRLGRAERREQILGAATRAFARAGYAHTGLDDVAAEAGISKVILYRHFESKNALYRAVLDRACTRLAEWVGTEEFTEESLPRFVQAVSDEPDGFRLVFRHAAREPEFRDFADELASSSVKLAHRHLAEVIPDPAWAQWAAQLVFTTAIEAAIAWLDAGRPDPDRAAQRIAAAVYGVIEAGRAENP